MSERKPPITVVMPVLNETGRVKNAVDYIFSLPAPAPVEVIVVDGDLEGTSLQALGPGPAIGMTAPAGRALQMNAGAKRAGGDALLFLHADTRLPRQAFFQVQKALSAGHVGGAFDLAFDSRRASLKLVAAMARVRSRLTRVPFGDQAQFFQRNYFFEIGGYAPVPLMEDIEIMRRIKKRGDRIRIIRDRVMTSARRYDEEGVTRRVAGNWILQARYMLGADPEKLALGYGKHEGRDNA